MVVATTDKNDIFLWLLADVSSFLDALAMFADHAHEAAKRYPVDGVYGATRREANAYQPRRKAKAELFDSDAKPLGRQEMPHLVNEDEEAQHREDKQPRRKPKH